MKRILLAIICCISSVARAQFVPLPDANFVSLLSSLGYSSCISGNQLDTTCPAVLNATSIEFSYQAYNIHDLTGIRYFKNLDTLYCYFYWGGSGYGAIDTFDAWPPHLTYLNIGQNINFRVLKTLPPTLVYLNCRATGVSSLPALPNGLQTLICDSTPLISLPALPNTITELRCGDNGLITSLPTLPDSLTWFDCSQMPNLLCLPKLNKVVYFEFHNWSGGITCLPNYPQSNVGSGPPLSSFPVCDLFNSNNCPVYWNIRGKVFLDNNNNCVQDGVDSSLNGIKVSLDSNGVTLQQTFTYYDGSYTFNADTGTYTISVDAGFPFVPACPLSATDTAVVTTQNPFVTGRDIAVKCKTGFDLIAQSMVAGRFRNADTTQLNITAGDYSNFFGAHCVTGVGGTVQLTISGSVSYVSPASGALTPSSVVSNTITWNIADFGAVNFFTDFNLLLITDSNATGHSPVCFTLIVNPTAGDNNPANNALTYCSITTTSFDPNEKQVYPSGDIDTAQHWLTYTIYFQNTGNASAHNVHVDDTLDTAIDENSVQVLAYSHEPMVQIKGNKIRFNFPNINLPDSNTNEPASHGYVQYKVKLKDNLPAGTNMSNTAFIYFDFNSPVVTNTVSNTIALATGIAANGQRTTDYGKIHLQPNPANESVTVSVDESMVGSNLIVTDITGREVLHSVVQIRKPKFAIQNFSPGVYFVTVENEHGSTTKKLIIQK